MLLCLQLLIKVMVNKIKALLFNLLKIDGYLAVVQKSYLFSYRLGLLKKDKAYKWHYFVSSLLRDGDHIIDIGANLGYFALPFADKVKKSGHLYCVEPVAPFQKQLKKFIANKPNVTLLPYALGEENDKKVTLGIPAEFQKLGYLRHGTTTLLHGGNGPDGKYSFEATMKKGSELFAGFPKIDYIKCDIEGYETVVFPEMKAIIEKYQPMVQLETWGQQLMTMYAFFKELGFAAYYLEAGRLNPLENKAKTLWSDSDILFVPPAKHERIASFLI
ncbi:MAG: FkbM family methyltransferase [Flavisolibacter sp.]|nr:FkbM family methyltransferase [Flavisolibacter sp.]